MSEILTGSRQEGAAWVVHRAQTGNADTFIGVGSRNHVETGKLAELILALGPDARGNRSQQQIVFQNGATVMLFSAQWPEQLCGPEFDSAWLDSLTAEHKGGVFTRNVMLQSTCRPHPDADAPAVFESVEG